MTTAREALEMAAREARNPAHFEAYVDGPLEISGRISEAILALAASLPAESAALPEGWVMVPKSVWEELERILVPSSGAAYKIQVERAYRLIRRTMLASAPKPNEEGK